MKETESIIKINFKGLSIGVKEMKFIKETLESWSYRNLKISDGLFDCSVYFSRLKETSLIFCEICMENNRGFRIESARKGEIVRDAFFNSLHFLNPLSKSYSPDGNYFESVHLDQWHIS